MDARSYTVFENKKIISKGSLGKVVKAIKDMIGKGNHSAALIFDDLTGRTIDIDFSGSMEDVEQRISMYITPKITDSNTGPGRPKLGVISREVSLLPQHWEWLALQRGGASASIRKLIDGEIKSSTSGHNIRFYQDAVAQFMSVIGGDLPNYEEATRLLYRKDKEQFLKAIENWPEHVRNHVEVMSLNIFSE